MLLLSVSCVSSSLCPGLVCECGISWSYSLTFGPFSSLAAMEGCHVVVVFCIDVCGVCSCVSSSLVVWVGSNRQFVACLAPFLLFFVVYQIC